MVPQNKKVRDFVNESLSKVKLNKLQSTIIANQKAWVGYVDEKKLIHQLVLVASVGNQKGVLVITAQANPEYQAMLKEYVTSIDSITTLGGNSYELKPSEINPKKGFVIQITSKLVTKDYSVFENVLKNLLSPDNPSRVYHYFVYVREGNDNGSNTLSGTSYPKKDYLNHQYYLLTDNEQLKEGKYGTDQVQIVVRSAEDDNLGMYLADPLYCQQDSDCGYRSNFCEVGVFNPYHQFVTPWGCGGLEFQGLGPEIELKQRLGCTGRVEIKYTNIRCVDNTCQLVDPTPVCR